MLSPILYDFKKTFLSKGSLIVIFLVAVIGLSLVPFIKSSASTSFVKPFDVQGATVDRDRSIYFIIHFINGYGEPLASAQAHIVVYEMTSGKLYLDKTFTSDETGYIKSQLIITENIINNTDVYLNMTVSYGPMRNSIMRPLGSMRGKVNYLFPAITTIKDRTNSSKTLVQVFSVGPDGEPPKDYKIHYYLIQNKTVETMNVGSNGTHIFFMPPRSISKKAMKISDLPVLTTVDSYITEIDPYKLISGNKNVTGIILILSDQEDKLIWVYGLNKSELYPRVAGLNIKELLSSFVMGLLSSFVPIMAILDAYFGYGGDRVKGYLEMILARPVTRLGVALSRYLSIILSLVTAIAILAGLMDLSIYYTMNSFISTDLLAGYIASFIVESAALVGIILALSHLVKSTGGLIGIGIGLWIVLSFFWNLIIFLISSSIGINIASAEYQRLNIYLSYINPVKYSYLVDVYRRGYITGVGGRVLITPAQYGLTLPTLVILAAIWIIVPLALFLYLATKRD
jgi:ABC-type transport system involved in multi-copper enzyme maturation permease subunit